MTIKTTFYTFKQGNNMSLQHYHELFLGQVAVMDKVGISISDEAMAAAITRDNNHVKPNANDHLLGANPSHSAEYLAHLQNSHLEGNDLYHKTLTEANHALSRCEQLCGSTTMLDGGKGILFVNNGQVRQMNRRRRLSSVSTAELKSTMPISVTSHRRIKKEALT